MQARRARRDLSFPALVSIARSSLREAAEDRIAMSAASLAFHWFLAIFPASIALVALTRRLGLSTHQLNSVIHALGVLFPKQMSHVLTQALRAPGTAGNGVELVLGFLVALWSSVEAMASLQVGLDVAYEVPGDRGFVGRRIMALPLLAATVVIGGAASALLILGDPIRSLLPASFTLARPAFDVLWGIVRWCGALVLTLGLLSIYYTVGPNRARWRWQWVSPGSVCAGLAWLAASGLFSLYLNEFGHESQTYGAFAGVAVLLLWLYLTATAVLLGAELNCELARPAQRPV